MRVELQNLIMRQKRRKWWSFVYVLNHYSIFINLRHNKHHLQLSPPQKDAFLLSRIPATQAQEPAAVITRGSRNTCVSLASSGKDNALAVFMWGSPLQSRVSHCSGSYKERKLEELLEDLPLFSTSFRWIMLSQKVPAFVICGTAEPPKDWDRELQMRWCFPDKMLVISLMEKKKF